VHENGRQIIFFLGDVCEGLGGHARPWGRRNTFFDSERGEGDGGRWQCVYTQKQVLWYTVLGRFQV